MGTRTGRTDGRRRRALLAGALAFALLGASGGGAQLPDELPALPLPDELPEADGRAGLLPGQEASTDNLEVLASLPKADGMEAANSDLAFAGDLAYVGNFAGVQIIDISDPSAPEHRTTIRCPGSQNDVSVSDDLLFVSVESGGTVGCDGPGTEGATPFRGVRVFDVSDPDVPVQIAAVQTCRGSHTHSLLDDPDDPNLYVYVSGVITPRTDAGGEGLDCSAGGPDDPDDARWRIDIVEVPRDAPQDARLVAGPRIFAEGDRIDGLQQEPQTPLHPSGEPFLPEPVTTSCHDITTYVEIGLAAGACEGNGILLDISDPVAPVRVASAADPNYSYWHSATFNDDGTTVVFTDEWGGGILPRCTPRDRPEWGANAIYDVVRGDDGSVELEFASYYKIPNTQSPLENCVAHNGSLIPIPGRDVMVQAWYQGGISIFDFTDSANPVEIGWFDRGPFLPGIDGPADDDPLLALAAGFWSAYWYDGHIYGTEIGRGFDVLELSADDVISDDELAAARSTELDEVNPQAQVGYAARQPGVRPACDRVGPRRFPDISGPPHGPAVGCIAGFGIARGATDGTYRPAEGVRRDQMASFVARTLQVAGVELPASPPRAFGDIAGNTHELAIRQIAALGVTQGREPGRYDPSATVPRGQMARFVVNALEVALAQDLAAASAGFPDTPGTTHADAIDVAVDLGIVRGFPDGTFGPAAPVRRDQMGTFLAGALQAVLDVGGDRELTPFDE